MNEKTTTLETFKTAKDALLTEYKIKELELATLRKELVKLGVLTAEETGASAIKTRKTRKTGGKRVKVTVENIIAALGKDELGYKDIAAKLGAGDQTVKKLLDNSKKFTSRHKDPKNPKSKKCYKVK